jgi:hypothetical protein
MSKENEPRVMSRLPKPARGRPRPMLKGQLIQVEAMRPRKDRADGTKSKARGMCPGRTRKARPSRARARREKIRLRVGSR